MSISTIDSAGINQAGNTTFCTTSGNVGIGTASPSVKLQTNVTRTSGTNVTALVLSDSVTGAQTTGYGTQIQGWSNAGSAVSAIGFEAYGGTNNDTAIAFYTQYTAGALTRRATIDAYGVAYFDTLSASVPTGGNVLLGPTSTAAPRIATGHATGTPTGSQYAQYYYAGTSIGSISQNGTTAVAYNTTSDYRLKTDVTPINDALSTIGALNPISFTWVDGRKDDGFLAHEMQAIIPNCVTGEKDAVDEDGNPVYQQMDNSGVIPFLVKAIQELKAIVDAQAVEIAALKGTA
jgi:hypothetical protein